jgi:hypothetical protein
MSSGCTESSVSARRKERASNHTFFPNCTPFAPRPGHPTDPSNEKTPGSPGASSIAGAGSVRISPTLPTTSVAASTRSRKCTNCHEHGDFQPICAVKAYVGRGQRRRRVSCFTLSAAASKDALKGRRRDATANKGKASAPPTRCRVARRTGRERSPAAPSRRLLPLREAVATMSSASAPGGRPTQAIHLLRVPSGCLRPGAA